MIKNLFYFYRINSIGGIESFFYNLAKKYEDKDIVIYYQVGDPEQVKRMQKYVRVRQWKGEEITCKYAFFNFNLDIIDHVHAEKYFQIAHGDYKAMGIKPNLSPKITDYIGVSKQACETYSEITGKPCQLCYNPLIIDRPKKVLNLISATRLTREKGKERIRKLMKAFEDAGIPYIWTIYTDDFDEIKSPNIIYRRPRLDIIDFIGNADYLVQLSDNEGFCYSVIEALSVGTPVIVTDCPVFKELGVKNGENGFILPFDMSNIPLDAIISGVKPFTFDSPADGWEKILAKGKSQYKADFSRMVKLKAKIKFYDIELAVEHQIGEEFEANAVRAEYLIETVKAAERSEENGNV